MLPFSLLAIFYTICLCYLFLGISIVSDTFMAAIEVITSKTKKIKFQDERGHMVELNLLVWNPTIANLTLMALGSSAPEILLAIIETASTLDSDPGELGPSTIVGSAALNLLLITGICILVVPVPAVKKIKDRGVFAITTAF